MTEPRSGLPGAGGVARRAVRAQLPVVLVCMAALAIGRKTKISMVQVLHRNARARGGRNVCGFVAVVAPDGRVTPGKREARLAVVHGLAVRLPANQREVGAIVLGVAGGAILSRCVRREPYSVHAASLRHSLPNLRMAIEASKLDLPTPKCVAFRATQRTRKRFVRLRQGSWRDLRAAGGGQKQTEEHTTSEVSCSKDEPGGFLSPARGVREHPT